MLKCFGKMKTSYLLLQVFYVTNILNLAFISDAQGAEICQLLITTNINNRYATTTVVETVTNTASTTEEFTFTTIFPNTAFLTGFTIEKNGKNYTSYIEENTQARSEYKSGGSSKSSNCHCANVRDSQRFSTSVNLEAKSETTFYLTYEELLQRKHGRYEQVFNINPGKLVTNLGVLTNFNELSKITELKVLKLRSGDEIDNENEELDPQAFVSEHNRSGVVTSAKILWLPSEAEQKTFAEILKTKSEGFAGQFIIQYNVGGDENFGEIITSDGYFVNFFAPKGLDPLTKHVVFVLDTSGSMKGQRISQLKEAMRNMLPQLKENDLFSLVEFNTGIKVWNLNNPTQSIKYVAKTSKKLDTINFPKPYQATANNIEKAIKSVGQFKAIKDTDILSSLKVGLRLVELGRDVDKVERLAIILFLTDGKPTVGVRSYDTINDEVAKLNTGLNKATISTLSFGTGTYTDFLRKLALRNNGFYKHIYEAKDSDLQIEAFFETISVPVLSNINFNYDSSQVSDVSRTEFSACNEGSELVVAGQYSGTEFKPPKVEALSAKGSLDNPVIPVLKSETDISHLWAFVTANELLNQIKVNPNNTKEELKNVLDVCSKYSFVTPYSSMVIVKSENEKFVMGTDELTIVPSHSKPVFRFPRVGHRMGSFENLKTSLGQRIKQ